MSLRSASRVSASPIRGSFCRAMAYALGLRIVDERTGVIHDFTKRRRSGREDILRSESFVPSVGLETIGAFCNRVQRRNKHKRAVYGRLLIIALVKEASIEANWAALVDLAQRIRAHYGVGVTVAMHDQRYDKKEDSSGIVREVGNGNIHAHVYLAYCAVDDKAGLGNKVMDLDPIACSRAKRRNLCQIVRPLWTQCINEQLEGEGVTGRVDLRKLADQGIDEQPTVPLGPRCAALERQDTRTPLGNLNRSIDQRNRLRKRLLKHLDRLTEIQIVLGQFASNDDTQPSRQISKRSTRRMWQFTRALKLTGHVQFASKRYGVIALKDEGRVVCFNNEIKVVIPGRLRQAQQFVEKTFGIRLNENSTSQRETITPRDASWLPSLPATANKQLWRSAKSTGDTRFPPSRGDSQTSLRETPDDPAVAGAE